MIERTPRGTASDKAGGTTLTISSVTVPEGHSLVVGVVCEGSQLAPITVTHSGRTLNNRKENDGDINTSSWVKGEYHKDQTGDIVATWPEAIVERAMVASSYSRPHKKTGASGRSELETDSPRTGNTNELDPGIPYVVCFFGSVGPVEDHDSATARMRENEEWVDGFIGQKAGTTGGAVTSNVTIVESYLQLKPNRATTRGQLQDATPRVWSNVLLVLGKKRSAKHSQAITPSDRSAVRPLVIAAGGDVNAVTYGFNENSGQWEANEPITGTMVRNNDTGEWS